MDTPLTEAAIRGAVSEELRNEAEFAYLLGSAATPRFQLESDIDLAVFWRQVPSFERLVQVKTLFEEKWGREIDLVTLNEIDLIFGRQVLETGRLLFRDSPGLHLEWRARQLSAYPDFKRSRAVIEKNILHRKRYV